MRNFIFGILLLLCGVFLFFFSINWALGEPIIQCVMYGLQSSLIVGSVAVCVLGGSLILYFLEGE